jgi:hypothetical protein
VRIALDVADSVTTAQALIAGGAEALAEPILTRWSHPNVRLRAPDGMQLTRFTFVDSADA